MVMMMVTPTSRTHQITITGIVDYVSIGIVDYARIIANKQYHYPVGSLSASKNRYLIIFS